MIYDRTASDISIAKTLRKKVQSGQTLTDAQKSAIERGSFTIVSLNRIESKQAELMQILNSYAYMVNIETKTDWQASDIFTYQHQQRLLENLNKLKKAYYIYTSTPETPNNISDFLQANAVEKILFDIENMINKMVSRFRICGTFNCGEDGLND